LSNQFRRFMREKAGVASRIVLQNETVFCLWLWFPVFADRLVQEKIVAAVKGL
jgi:hypothetical protein